MKFKPITPGMVIHCPTKESTKVLIEHLDEMGYTWKNGELLNTVWGSAFVDNGERFYLIHDEKKMMFTSKKKCEENGQIITEFSDLIELDLVNEPKKKIVNEMSAVEVLEWLKNNAGDTYNAPLYEVFGFHYAGTVVEAYDAQDIIEGITAYEAAKAPKPVEVEWARKCRVIQKKNGITKVVYEEWLKDAPPFGDEPNESEQAEIILKKYIAEHGGKYFAVVEDICRVKESKS